MASGQHLNKATSGSPGSVVFLLDISGSMGKLMQDGSTRLKAVEKALRATLNEMAARSRVQEEIHPRYHVAVYLYSDKVHDVFGGFQPIDTVFEKGFPGLERHDRTDMASGFYYVKQLLERELSGWNSFDLENRPAPLVIHMTDAEIKETFRDPTELTKEIRAISVPDGNVLIENLFITDEINIKVSDISVWQGFSFDHKTGNPLADKLLAMSSRLPESYRDVINRDQHLVLEPSIAMMFPGNSPDVVKSAFMMSMATGQLGSQAIPRDGLWESDDKE